MFKEILQIPFYNTATLLITGLALSGLFLWLCYFVLFYGSTPSNPPIYKIGESVEVIPNGMEVEILGSICIGGRFESLPQCGYRVRLPNLSTTHFNESELRKK